MDSLLATYASSDEEEEEQQQHREENHQQNQNLGRPSKFSQPSSSIPSSSIFSSLPQPKSSSLFSSLPPPNIQTPSLSSTHKADDNDDDDDSISTSVYIGVSSAKFSGTAKISPLFSSLPEPKSHLSNPPTSTNPSSSIPKPKRVVQFKPPINPISVKSHDDIDDDEDDEENERKRRKELDSFIQTPSVKSFLSSIPAPKNSGAATLGALPSSGSGRRSIIEADIPASTVGHEVGIDSNVTNYDSNWIEGSSSASSLGAVDGQSGSIISGGDPSNWVEGSENYGNYGSYVDYGSYGHNYESNWVDRSTTSTMPEMPAGMSESMLRVAGKRGRNEVPMEIVEVKQDELIKNRPREDQVKLTGIAFGPSYQPVSAKGKPTKLHKRKHQISSLYYDMKQKEMELSERRAKGFLTKAETQAKYGW